MYQESNNNFYRGQQQQQQQQKPTCSYSDPAACRVQLQQTFPNNLIIKYPVIPVARKNIEMSPRATAADDDDDDDAVQLRQHAVSVAGKNIKMSSCATAAAAAAADNDDDDDDDGPYRPSDQETAAFRDSQLVLTQLVLTENEEDVERLGAYPLTSDVEYVIPHMRSANNMLSDRYGLSLSVARKTVARDRLSEAETGYSKTIRYIVPSADTAFHNNISDLEPEFPDDVSRYYRDFKPRSVSRSVWGTDTDDDDGDSKFCFANAAGDGNLFEELLCDDDDVGLSTGIGRGKGSAVAFATTENENYDKTNGKVDVQDVFSHFHRHFSREHGLIRADSAPMKQDHLPAREHVRMYRSSKLMAALLVLHDSVKYVHHTETNSCGDFTCFAYDFQYIEPEHVRVLESFLCFTLQTERRIRFDMYEGEWTLVLYTYWELCTRDLRHYREQDVRTVEKATLGHLMLKVYDAVRKTKKADDPSIDFKIHVARNALRKLDLYGKRTVPVEFLEYVKHYFHIFSEYIGGERYESLWNDTFAKLGVHHANCRHTYEEVTRRRARVLFAALSVIDGYRPDPATSETSERDVPYKRFVAVWRRVAGPRYVSALDGQVLEDVPRLDSHLFKTIGKHIPRTEINTLFKRLFVDDKQISSRLQYEVETFYQFFIDMLAEYLYATDVTGHVTTKNGGEFFLYRMHPLRKRYVYVNCVTNVAVTYKLRKIVEKSTYKTVYAKRGSASRCRDVKLSHGFMREFFTLINECLSLTCAPLFLQFGANDMDPFEWNTQLCACFEEFRTLVFDCYGVCKLPTWYVSSTVIDPEFTPAMLDVFGSSDALWRFVNVTSVADEDDPVYQDGGRDDDDVAEDEAMKRRVKNLAPLVDATTRADFATRTDNSCPEKTIFYTAEFRDSSDYDSCRSSHCYSSSSWDDDDDDGGGGATDDSQGVRKQQLYKRNAERRHASQLYVRTLTDHVNAVEKTTVGFRDTVIPDSSGTDGDDEDDAVAPRARREPSPIASVSESSGAVRESVKRNLNSVRRGPTRGKSQHAREKREKKPTKTTKTPQPLKAGARTAEYDPNTIYPTFVPKRGATGDRFDHTTDRSFKTFVEARPKLRKAFSVDVFLEKNGVFFDTWQVPELLLAYTVRDDFFGLFNAAPYDSKPLTWIDWNGSKNITRPSSSPKLFPVIRNKQLQKGARSFKCVLCAHANSTSYSMIVNSKTVVGACLYCVHFLNLMILYDRITFQEIKTELKKRIGYRHKAPLCFDANFEFIKTMPDRTEAKQIHAFTYNKMHSKYGHRLKLEENSQILLDMGIRMPRSSKRRWDDRAGGTATTTTDDDPKCSRKKRVVVV